MRIGDICVYAPKSQIKAGEAVEGAKYMFFTSGADENKRYCDYQLEGEGIIMGTGGNATLHYYSGKYAVSTDCVVLMPDEIVRCKYLYYFFKANINVLEAGFKGAGLRHTNKKYIDDIIIKNIPGYDEQDKIIRTLDKLQDIVDKRNHELCLLDSLIKARFIEMFSNNNYPILKWREVFNTTTGRLDSNASVENGKYPFFTCSKDILKIDSYAFDQKALLLAGNNAAGKYDVKYYSGKFNAYQRTYVLGLKDNWSYQLFKYQLEDKLTYLQQQSLGGLTKYLTMKILEQLDFIVPPIEKQLEFDDFVKQVDKSKLAVQESLEKTQQLFDSLMQEYFG